jgi:hypothetical protein
MIDNYIDHADEKKTRRALLTVAIVTIFISNMEFGASTLKLLGLEFIFNQHRLVAFGQIASGILLMIYLIRSSPVYLSLLKDLAIRNISQRELEHTKRWTEIRDGVDTKVYPAGPQGKLLEVGDRFTKYRSMTEQIFSIITAFMAAMAILVVDFGVPLTIGTIAAFDPGKVSSIIDHMVEQQSDAAVEENDKTDGLEGEPVRPITPAPLPAAQPEPLP